MDKKNKKSKNKQKIADSLNHSTVDDDAHKGPVSPKADSCPLQNNNKAKHS